MKLSIVVVSYNVKDYIKQCIRSIYRSNLSQDLFEIIIIDNDSHDGTVKDIKKSFNDIHIIENNVNEGFSKAVNRGIKKANGEFICLINPDVIINENTLSSLIRYLELNKNTGCIGPKIINADGSIQHSCKRSFPTPLNAIFRLFSFDKIFPKSKFFGKYNLTYLNVDKLHKVDAISGAFMMFRKNIITEIGYFDEAFFMFGEDIDFCYRIKNKGYDIIYNPETEIMHYKGESVKNAPYDMVNIFYNAMEIYFKKHSNNYPNWKMINFFVKIGLLIRKSLSYFKLVVNNLFSTILDSLFIVIAFIFSIYLWYTNQHLENVNFHKVYSHWPLIVNFLASWYISSKLTQIYKQNYLAYTRIFLSILITFLISSTITYLVSFFAYSRGVLVLSTILSLLFLVFWRFIINFLYLHKIILVKPFKRFVERRALIIGADLNNIKIGNEITKNPYTNINIIGYIDEHNELLIENFLGKIKYIRQIVNKNQITEIIIRENYFNSNKIFQIIKALKGTNLLFKIIPRNNNIIISKGNIEQISGIGLMSYDIPLLDRSNILIKRCFDIILSFLFILITLPLYVFLAKKIRTKSIWGTENQKIKLYYIKSKFTFIRSFPSFYNILNGDISFVGSNIIDINNKSPKNILKPGLINLINTKRFKGNDENKINSYYIKNQSLTFDIEIILKSLFKA